jgi:hypothetical protein
MPCYCNGKMGLCQQNDRNIFDFLFTGGGIWAIIYRNVYIMESRLP